MKIVIESITKPIMRWAHIKYLKSQGIVDIWNHRIVKPVASERGDVPGWVLVTVMTAGLVAALWVVADTALAAMFSKAVESVSKP